ncbi:hypothetical protein ACROYT_G017811 [Oculina patagonica]
MYMHGLILSSQASSRESCGDHNMARRRKLYCMNGQYLEIGNNGRVKGTQNYHSPHVVLELAPVARDLIHIKGVQTGFYLAVNKYGEVYTTVMRNEECIFREKLTRNFYDNYCSYKYSHKGLALGLMKTGAAVTVSRTAGSGIDYETQFITMVTL